MEEDMLVMSKLCKQRTTPFSNCTIIIKVDDPTPNVLRRHRIHESGDLLRKAAIASEQLQEDDRW